MSDLAIIIPHFNDETRLRRCLSALSVQVDAEVQVIVVDNGSDEPLFRIADEFPWARFAIEAARGAGPARNLGVALTTAPRLAFLDCDCVPAYDWVATARRLDLREDIIGGRVDTFHEDAGPHCGAQVFEQVFAFDMARYVSQQGFCGSGNMVTSRDVFNMVGPFLADVSEDMEWCHRAARTGFEIKYDDTLVARHPTRSDWFSLRRKWRRLASERFLIDGHSRHGRIKWFLRAVLTAGSVLRDIPKVLLTERLSGAGDRLKCLAVLCRLRVLRAVWMGKQAFTGQA